MPDQPADRRGAHRFAVVMDAEATDLLTRSTVKLRCSDISISGCYLDFLNPIPDGTDITVKISRDNGVFETPAKVVYNHPGMGLGIRFVASPRHADLLLVTGPVSRHMRVALQRTYEATPEPRLVVAVGNCGCTGGVFGENYASCGRVANVIPVDVAIPGCPPTPTDLLKGILAAVDRRRAGVSGDRLPLTPSPSLEAEGDLGAGNGSQPFPESPA